MFSPKCNMNKRRIITPILSGCALASLALLLTHIGYGHAVTLTKAIAATTPKPTQLTVIYERSQESKKDFIHLKIDTTYHSRGKNGYLYEIFCDHEISLYAFNEDYTPLKAKNGVCFIEGSERKWLKTNDKKSILDYHCYHALMADDSSSWEAWYCDALPHRPDIARLSSHHKGLILAVRNNDNSYFLKAKHIKHTTI